MNRLRYVIAVGAAVLVSAPAAHAQVRSTGRTSGSVVVPAGMCRIWIDGVPENRQPGATDCATARATVPPNGRIIYGDQRSGRVYGSTGQYDPRLDPRNPQYDPRLDPRNRNGQWDARADRERAKWERKRAKQQRKEWEKSHRRHDGNDDGDDEDDDHDDDDDDRGGPAGVFGQSGERGQSGHGRHDDHDDHENRNNGHHGGRKG